LGWEFDSPLGMPHACYASLYIWRGEGEPIEPERKIYVYPVKKEDKENE